MKELIGQCQEKIDAFNQRERILIFASAVIVVVMLIQTVLIDPVLDARKQIERDIFQINQDISQKKSEQQVINILLNKGINQDKIKHRDSLKAAIAALKIDIEASVNSLIPPKLMAEVLGRVLISNTTIKLLGLENKPVEPIIEQIPGGEKGLFKHAFILHLEGDYHSTISYLEHLSELPWQFHWNSLNFQVIEYPRANITLEVHTVSMSREWIGV